MQKKTVKKVVSSKMQDWLNSITYNQLAIDLKKNILVSGGSIASMFLNEDVNDYDVYINDMDVLHRLCKYYAMMHNVEVLDGRKQESMFESEFGWVDKDGEDYSFAKGGVHYVNGAGWQINFYFGENDMETETWELPKALGDMLGHQAEYSEKETKLKITKDFQKLLEIENLKNLRIVDITNYHPIKEKLGLLSHELEYKLKNQNSERSLITERELFNRIRDIIDLVEKL